MGRLSRLFRGRAGTETPPARTGPGSVTGRQPSGIILTSGIGDWVPPEVAQAPSRERPVETGPSDWLPPDLPARRSAPPPPERKRSTVNQVPPELLDAKPPPATAPPAAVATAPPPPSATAPTAAAEPAPPAPPAPAAPPRRSARPGAVDLNTASADELAAVPGLTRPAAARIVEHREAHGPYRSVDDLLALAGFHAARVEQLAEHVTV